MLANLNYLDRQENMAIDCFDRRNIADVYIMRTSKKLLLKRRLNERAIPYIGNELPQLSLMQQYQNWSCVLDPAIALSHHGVLIAESISKEIELWVVQELWNIVKDADFYSERIELITPKTDAEKRPAVEAEVMWSIGEWEKTKQEKDLAKLGMYWLGDNLQESLMPKDLPVGFFKQWQASASALDRHNEKIEQENDILNLAFRDTVALAASLRSAFVLTYQPSIVSPDSSPAICKVLENWGISCQVKNNRNPIVAMERQYLRQLIVRAGLGKLLLAGVNLAAFHLVIPSILTSRDILHYSSVLALKQNKDLQQDRESYFWNNVKGVWYYL